MTTDDMVHSGDAAEGERTECESGARVNANEPSPTVVGIGASAGGLAALQELFRRLPAGTGACFVVVQHLSPDEPSLTPDIIARTTSIPTSSAEDGMSLRCDEIVFLPPGASLRAEGDVLRLEAKGAGDLTSSVIDKFFRSLAEEIGPRALGVVLSGAGSDGTIGLKAIRDAGGHTLVQDPATAEFDGMPRSAIRAGAADHVERIPELAARIVDLVARRATAPSIEAVGEMADDAQDPSISRILTILRRETGHEFSGYKRGTLTRRLLRRLALLGIGDLEGYVEELERNGDEVDALFRDMMISVTEFFRDSEAWEVLADTVVPALCEAGNDDEGEIRVWVPGCATGEEVYSLAILLEEHLAGEASRPEVKIFATDIDERALEFAREGLYPDGIADSVSAGRLERFFEREDHHYRIAKRLREQCIFTPHNLLSDPSFSRLNLLSCRNLLIYLDPDAQATALRVFQYSLRPGGWLFLGSSETLTSQREMFETVDKSHRLFRRNDVAGTPPTELLNKLPRTRRLQTGYDPAPRRDREARTADLRRKVEHILVQSEGPAAVLVDERHDVVQFFGRTGRFLEPSAGGASSNVVDMALPGLRPVLRAAVREAARTGERVRRPGVRMDTDGSSRLVDLVVRPVELGVNTDQLLIVLHERSQPWAAEPGTGEEADDEASTATSDASIRELEAELIETREHLQATIEEIESANEELQSTNEELLSMNEELQTSKEEAQSINEELKTVNAELTTKMARLDEAHSDIENLFRSTRIATIFLDKQRRIQRFTPSTVDLFRLRDSDVGRPIEDIAPRFDDGDLVGEIEAVLEDLVPRQMEVRTPGEGGWYVLRISPYRTVNDVIEGVVLTFNDVTDMKQTSEQLRQEREYARSVVETVSQPLIVLGPDLNVHSASRAFYETFGVEPGDVEGRPVDESPIAGSLDVELGELLAATASEGTPIEDREIEVRISGGRKRIMRFEARPVTETGGGSTNRILVTLDDVTERRRRDTRLEEESQRKDWFLAMLGHELRNPLAPIRTGIELLQELGLDEGRRGRVLEMMERQLGHLVNLLDDLLDLSRVTSGVIPMERETLDLGSLVRTAIEDHRPEFERADIAIDLEVPDGPAWIRGDATRLHQALDNLLSNARKYTPAEGRVTVRLEPRSGDGEVALSVSDTGIGMDAEMVEQAFDQFHQGPRGPASTREGLGLGLTLVRVVAEAHDGVVQARSAGPGQGTVIELCLPLTEEPTDAEGGEASVPEAEHPGAQAGRRILLVEDKEDSAEALRMLLEHRSHEVVVAHDGEAALQAAAEFRPRTILCDLGLPGSMSGYDVARAIRDDRELSSIRLVAVTGFGQKKDRERAREAGFDAFLVKPVSGDDLASALA